MNITSYRLLIPIICGADTSPAIPPSGSHCAQHVLELTPSQVQAHKQRNGSTADGASSSFFFPGQRDEERCAIILCHGLTGNWRTFSEVAPPLCARTRMPVLMFDQTAHGENSVADRFKDLAALESALSPDQLARDLMARLLDIGLVTDSSAAANNKTDNNNNGKKTRTKLILFGQSYGTKTCLAFADRYSSLVAAVGLGDLGCRKNPKRGVSDGDYMQLAVAALAKHTEYVDSEEEVRAYLNEVRAETGDDISRKFVKEEIQDEQQQQQQGAVDTPAAATPRRHRHRILVRPHVGWLHEGLCRKSDFVDTVADIDVVPRLLVLRADDEFTCLSDDEVALMKELRHSAGAKRDLFVTVPGAQHGVHRSHPWCAS